mmetsp:Transcript_16005/g.29312  ORF Transcript_16005/g.29312 Transcript_16005/m.29312 type:complete len:234 (+) Transcript_16005:313-1014(+)
MSAGSPRYRSDYYYNIKCELKPADPSLEYIPASLELFLEDFDEVSKKYRCASSNRLIRAPCKVNGAYYERSLPDKFNLSNKFQSKIRTFVLKTLNLLHALSPNSNQRSLDITAECLQLLTDTYLTYKIRALTTISPRDSEYVLIKYAESAKLIWLVNVFKQTAHRPGYLNVALLAMKLVIQSPNKSRAFWDQASVEFSYLRAIGNPESSGVNLEALKYLDQDLLESLSSQLKP